MVSQLNKANSFFDLDLSMTNGIVSSKINDKWDGFNFEIVNFPFLDEMFLTPLAMVYTFRNLFVLQEYVLMLSKLLKQGYRFHKLRKDFSKFYHRYSESIVKYSSG